MSDTTRRQVLGGAAAAALHLSLPGFAGATAPGSGLVKAWEADFSPDGDRPLPFSVYYAEDAARLRDRIVPVDRHRDAEGTWYGAVGGALFRDDHHGQRTMLYLALILSFQGTGGGPQEALPPRVNHLGGEWRLELMANRLHLAKPVQITTLFQSFDTEAFDGRGANVNYLCNRSPSICEQLGFLSPYLRPKEGQDVTSGWVPVSVAFTADEEDWLPLDGVPFRVAREDYGRSASLRRAYESELLNLMLVFHAGPEIPSPEPTMRPDGDYGGLLIRKCELWVDPALNP